MKKGRVFCPVNGWDCCYWKKNGECSLSNPIKECDDFAFFWDEDEDYIDYTDDIEEW